MFVVALGVGMVTNKINVSNMGSWRFDVPPELQEWVRNRLTSAHVRAVRAMSMFLMTNIVIVTAVLYGELGISRMLPMLALFGLGIVHRTHLASPAGRKRQKRRPRGLEQAFIVNSMFLGLATLVTLAMAFPLVSPSNQLLLAVSGTIQIAGMAFMSRTIPLAAVIHAALITLGLWIGLAETGGISSLGAALLTLASTVLQIGMVLIARRSFVARILHERHLNESVSTVKMLLNDFESQGSDWLFELDHEGHMTKVTMRFADAVGTKAEDLNGRPFVSLFVEGTSSEELRDQISARRAFRNLVLEMNYGKGILNRWWSVSIRPVANSDKTRFRGVISDVSIEKHAEARAHHMANYDSLTELPNRRMLIKTLNVMLRERRADSRLGLLFIDFDHFKAINDMYGHPIGDAFLKNASEQLLACMSESQLGGEGSFVARLGGDEFAILIAGQDAADKSVRLAQLLVDRFSETKVIDGIEMNSSVSIGLSLAPDHAESTSVLLSQADMALYVAKEEGRSRWEMFTSGIDEAVQQRHSIARDLRNAVGNGELRLFLQPLVDVDSGRNAGFEALMRWAHPERGMVMPDDFIPIAEETGLIIAMGEWMIRTAMAEAVSWDEPYAIAINLSPVQLRSPNLIPTIINALAETGIDPGRVELEITETVLLHDCEANIEVLNRLHALGLKVALDDFGTGYASLNYLLTFPFDKIKIDRSFVTDLENRQEAQAIISAVISLANQLGMCTLAEGVEHEEQLTHLRAEGCEMVQGWLFGKAMPVEHYGTLLKGGSDLRKVA